MPFFRFFMLGTLRIEPKINLLPCIHFEVLWPRKLLLKFQIQRSPSVMSDSMISVISTVSPVSNSHKHVGSRSNHMFVSAYLLNIQGFLKSLRGVTSSWNKICKQPSCPRIPSLPRGTLPVFGYNIKSASSNFVLNYISWWMNSKIKKHCFLDVLWLWSYCVEVLLQSWMQWDHLHMALFFNKLS